MLHTVVISSIDRCCPILNRQNDDGVGGDGTFHYLLKFFQLNRLMSTNGKLIEEMDIQRIFTFNGNNNKNSAKKAK